MKNWCQKRKDNKKAKLLGKATETAGKEMKPSDTLVEPSNILDKTDVEVESPFLIEPEEPLIVPPEAVSESLPKKSGRKPRKAKGKKMGNT